MGLLGLSWLLGQSLAPASTTTEAAAGDTSRLAYDDLFQLNWRQTDQEGNVSVEVTYFTPELRASLEALKDPSEHQQQMQRSLTDMPGTAALFYVVIVQPEPFIGAPSVSASLTVGDSMTALQWLPLDPLWLNQQQYSQRDGFLWTAESRPLENVILTVTYPESTTHRFAWSGVLGL